MGIPYSREINAAFEQVTPLVAAGYKLLQTMRNISILLAVIQVLTVFLLVLVLGVGLLLVYSVNPDLEQERKQFVTPFLRWLAHLTVWSVVRATLSAVLGVGASLAVSWWFFFGMGGVEREGDEDAERALEGIEGEGEGEDKGKKGKNGGKKGGKKEEGEKDGKGEEREGEKGKGGQKDEDVDEGQEEEVRGWFGGKTKAKNGKGDSKEEGKDGEKSV